MYIKIVDVIQDIFIDIKKTLSDIQGKPLNKLKNQNLLHETWPKVVKISTISAFIVLADHLFHSIFPETLYTLLFQFLFLLMPLVTQVFIVSKIKDLILNIKLICIYLFFFQNTINIYLLFNKPQLFDGKSITSFVIYLVLNLFIYFAQKNLKINFMNLIIILGIQIFLKQNPYFIIFHFSAFSLLIMERELCLLQIALLLDFQKQILNTLPIGCIIYGRKDKKLLFTNKFIEEKVYSSRKSRLTKEKRKSSLLMNYIGQTKMGVKIQRFLSKLFVQIDREQIQNLDENIHMWDTLLQLFSIDNKKGQHKYYCINNEFFEHPQSPTLLLNQMKLIKQKSVFFQVLVNTGVTYDNQDCLMISIHDITTEFKSQKYEQMNLFKSQLLKSISHELRTRLNIVQGILEILQHSNLRLPDLTNVNYAYNNCRIQSHIIGSIIDYNLLKEGHIERNIKNIDIRLIIQDLQQLFLEECRMKNIDIKVHFECQLYELETDIERLMHVLINIMSNAVKFTDKNGYIDITISQKRTFDFDEQFNTNILDFLLPEDVENLQDHQNNQDSSLLDPIQELTNRDKFFVIQIKDSGQGISDNKLKLISSIFLNDDPILFEEEDKAQGFMLGLRSSCKLLKFINDDYSQNWLKIRSQNNQGTQIQLGIFCCQDSSNKDDSKSKKSSHHGRLRLGSGDHSLISDPYEIRSQFQLQVQNHASPIYRSSINRVFIINQKKCSCSPVVMIVDDEPFNLMVLENLLKIYGIKVLKANNGHEFIQMFKKSIHQCFDYNCRIYEFVIMDFQMPIANGAEATEQALELCRQFNRKDLIIIGCTAFSDQKDLDVLKLAGMQFVCVKPITKQKIKEIIKFVKGVQADQIL